MINVDDIVKLTLVAAVAFSLVVIAWQLARLLAAATGVIKEVEKTAQNVSEGSDLVLDDYRRLRGVVDMVSGLFNNVAQIKSMLENFTSMWSKEEKKTKKDKKAIAEKEEE